MKRFWLALCLAIFAAHAFPAVALAQDEAPAAAAAAAAEGEEVAEGEAAAEGEEVAGRTLADWYQMGGFVMHGLVLLSVLSLALVIERLWALRRNRIIPRKFMRNVMEHWRQSDIAQVVALCGAADNSIARVLRTGLIHFDEGLARVEDAVGVAGEHEATLLRRNLPVLAALGNIATMLGLLGTVMGMIQSFEIIAETGTGDAREVAGGIFQALITTAAGLMVGIAAIAAHSFLRRKVEVLEIDLEETSFRLLETLAVQPGGPPSAPSEPQASGLQPQEA